ncbi:hypothetical protein [Amycolatopsis sp. MtRt-6]|uniref:hypothetical protein n=1 Tax=Amycolatopsis sp. MtRt-6 TaxID=2792782 RepID=UPI001A8C9FC7|nr:hypothetical protein [Amycolatopsis sp. MtRt-6]
MTRRAAVSTRSASDGASVVQAVTVIMGVVVGLTFLFGFGNVLNLALLLAPAGSRCSPKSRSRSSSWSMVASGPAGGR